MHVNGRRLAPGRTPAQGRPTGGAARSRISGARPHPSRVRVCRATHCALSCRRLIAVPRPRGPRGARARLGCASRACRLVPRGTLASCPFAEKPLGRLAPAATEANLLSAAGDGGSALQGQRKSRMSVEPSRAGLARIPAVIPPVALGLRKWKCRGASTGNADRALAGKPIAARRCERQSWMVDEDPSTGEARSR
jgi:hypothetical protein